MKKRQFLTVIAFAVFLASAGCSQLGAPDTKTPRMIKEELKSLLGSPEVIVVDVRIDDEWKKSGLKIKGAVREDPEKFKSWADKYPKDKTLVFY